MLKILTITEYNVVKIQKTDGVIKLGISIIKNDIF